MSEDREATPEAATYDVEAVQDKWRKVWDDLDSFRAGSAAPGAEKRYALTMFPYPSGDLHMGHAEVMALHDVIARYWWQKGYDVLNPIGWDSFGLPAENAAIRNDADPAEWTYANIEVQAESFRRYAMSFDWSRRLHTSDPEYYAWTQWLFLKFRERGIAYRKNSPVNWCPNDQTVLANEQVVQGMCERCGAEVTKRELTQWYFKVTDYAQRLLDDMEPLAATWPDRVIAMQRNWIGRSEGAHVDFAIEGRDEPVTVFTTRPDTLFGATFFVVAADAKLARDLVTDEHRPALEAYLEEVRKATEIERLATDRPKTGVLPGRARHQPGDGTSGSRSTPPTTCWPTTAPARSWRCRGRTSGTGSSRRRSTCRSCARCSRPRASRARRSPATAPAINSANDEISAWTAWPSTEAKAQIIELAGRKGRWAPAPSTSGCVTGCCRGSATGDRRSRSSTATPAARSPCRTTSCRCKLPELRGADLKPKGVSPLAAAEDWVNVPCPTCGGPAKRDSDTMDTFVDSSWYFLRYCSPDYAEGPFDPEAVRDWMPAAQYVGGVEHAILHLMYARFFTKVLHDMGMVDFVEPFTALMNQGQVINRGKAMSKSLGNGVNLGEHDRRVRRRRRAADDGVRGTAGGRHRLGGPVTRGLAEVPAARVAALR